MSAISSRFARACWRPHANPAPVWKKCNTRLATSSNVSASGLRCMLGGFSTAISAAATGSTSPALVLPSILRRGWKKSPAGLVARSWRLRDLREYVPAAGLIWASFRSPVFRRPSASTACRMKRRRPPSGRECRIVSGPGQDQQRHPQPQHREAEDEDEIDQVLDELARRRNLPEIPDRAANPSLTEAKAEINDAEDHRGGADPKAAPCKFADRRRETDLTAVAL